MPNLINNIFSTSPCQTDNGGPQPPNLWTRASNNCVNFDTNSLDMRRKAEILQYKNNSSKFTKKELLSRSVQGYGTSAKKVWATQSYSTNAKPTNPNIKNLQHTNDFTLLCPYNQKLCANTQASNVPGKPIILCLDKNVPLVRYKYTNLNRTYLSSGTKFPQSAWKPGSLGFPIGKAGNNN